MDNVKVPKDIQDYLSEAYQISQQWSLPSGENYENSKSVDMQKVAVIGGGTMGRGIAIALCRGGYDVILVENDKTALENTKRELEITYRREQELKRFKEKDVARLRSAAMSFTTRLGDVKSAQFVIEAVFEDMQLKKDLFKKLDNICDKKCIFGTNTSSLDIDEMASPLRDKSRLVGIHFFNPPHVIKVVEIINGKHTSGTAVATAFESCRAMKKVAVLVGNVPGFVFNRLLFCYMEQAHRLLYEHGLLPNHVDEIVKSAGFLMGPITMHDMNGLDVGAKVKREQNWPQNPIEEELLQLKRYGRKNGKGFYSYDKDAKKHNDVEVEEIIRRLSSKAKIHNVLMSDQAVLEYLLFPMANEGYNLVEKKIIAHQSLIDIMFILGFGWPPATGGPMKWAEKRTNRLCELLRELDGIDKMGFTLSKKVLNHNKAKM